MSDRKNRDIGNKRVHQENKHECSCWLCEEGKVKLRKKKERELRREIQRTQGYSRIGLDNV